MPRNLAAIPVLLYPAWSHLCVAYDRPGYSLAGLVVLLALALALRATRRPPAAPAVAALGALAGVAAWDVVSPVPLALYLPPILVPAALAWLFGRSLLPGRTALITRFAVHVMGHDTPDTARYTRAVTAYWTGVFVVLALEAALLAALGSWPLWSLFTNGLNYALVATAFLAELGVRRLRFGRVTPVREFLLQVARTDLRRLG
ncbi:MAG: ketosynthase [Halofilum sp. (in: g-proteobacteria)]|nr:ketosynthase [Halofilum sp. (in: g-proteobacteria)]